MSCNGWKHLKNYRLNDDFCARNIEMRDASRKKTGSSQIVTLAMSLFDMISVSFSV